MKFPSMRGVVSYGSGVYGGKIDASNPRAGVVDDGNIAWPERVLEARRMWPQADAADFEPLDPRGRRWRDKASGVEYIQPGGAPLLSPGQESTRFISCFFVNSDGYLVFLQRADIEQTIYGPTSSVHIHNLGPAGPVPEGGIQ
jgi:hypothetical protein